MTLDKSVERDKVLVIDDEEFAISICEMTADFFEGVCVQGERFGEIEDRLREKPYAAILLDGSLRLYLDPKRKVCDGQVILDRLRNGEYGPKNQTTPVYSISSEYRFDGGTGFLGRLGNEQRVQKVARMLMETYEL
jgi:hypothetical protein